MLSSRTTAIGSFVALSDPGIVEIMGASGFDFAIIDTEHSPLTDREVEAHIRACEAAGITPFVRLRDERPETIFHALDAGAMGVVIPHYGLIQSEDSLRVTKYPPEGIRPVCWGVRAADYGVQDFSDYAVQANEEIMTIGLVEDAEVCERLDEVLERPGVDLIMPGPGDLASSFGVPGKIDDPRVVAVIDQIVEAAQRCEGLDVCMYVTKAEDVAKWTARGVRSFVCSGDRKMISELYVNLAKELKGDQLIRRRSQPEAEDHHFVSDHVDFVLRQWSVERPKTNMGGIGALARIRRAGVFLDKVEESALAPFGLQIRDF